MERARNCTALILLFLSSYALHLARALANYHLSFRNIYQYLDDCYVQGRAPPLPQLLLQLDSAEISLALPGPVWIAHPISYALGVVLGRWYVATSWATRRVIPSTIARVRRTVDAKLWHFEDLVK